MRERPFSGVLCLFIVVEICELVARALSIEHSSLCQLSGPVQNCFLFSLMFTFENREVGIKQQM